jgi:hypothetical protein
MGSKNKGGREARKPKQDKKAKPAATTSIVPPTQRSAGNQSQAHK